MFLKRETAMPDKKLKSLIGQLHEILEKTDELDPETRGMVTTLEGDIDRLLDAEDHTSDVDTIRESAQSLEASFGAEYPVAARFLREIIDMLAKVGI